MRPFISKFKIRDDILQTPKIHLTKSLIFKPKSVGFVCFLKKGPDNIPNLCCSGSSGPLLITHTGQSCYHPCTWPRHQCPPNQAVTPLGLHGAGTTLSLQERSRLGKQKDTSQFTIFTVLIFFKIGTECDFLLLTKRLGYSFVSTRHDIICSRHELLPCLHPNKRTSVSHFHWHHKIPGAAPKQSV